MNPIHLVDVLGDILEKKPRRVIFNPGTESETHIEKLEQAGIVVEQACTLVLLSTNQFELVYNNVVRVKELVRYWSDLLICTVFENKMVWGLLLVCNEWWNLKSRIFL